MRITSAEFNKMRITSAEFNKKNQNFWKLKLDCFPIKKVFRKTANNKKIAYFKPIMSEISANLKDIFREQKPPILKLEVGFFSDRKFFWKIFEKWQKFFHLKFLSKKKIKKWENFFGSSNTPGFETWSRIFVR